MPAVISVQKHTITLAAGTGSNSATLTGTAASNTGQCIPFVSSRITIIAGTQDDFSAYAVDAYFSGTTVVVATGTAATRAMVIEVTVVEFDDNEIDIQQDTYAMTNAEASDVVTLGTSVDTGTTFLYHTWQLDSVVDDNMNSAMVRGSFTGGGASVTLERETGAIWAVSGHTYTAEATAGTPYWTVQPVTVALTGGVTTTGDIPVDIVLTRSFLIGSQTSQWGGDDVDTGCIDSYISAVDTITCTREYSSGTDADMEFFVVEFKAGVSDNVQRGTLTQATQQASENVDITTPVDEAKSSVHTSGATGSFAVGRHTGVGSEHVPHAWCAWSFVDTGAGADTINMTYLLNDTSEPYSVSWEVIEWDVGAAAAPRRVMVRG